MIYLKKYIICVFLCFYLLCNIIMITPTYANEDLVQSKSAVVMEGTTGDIIYEKDKTRIGTVFNQAL